MKMRLLMDPAVIEKPAAAAAPAAPAAVVPAAAPAAPAAAAAPPVTATSSTAVPVSAWMATPAAAEAAKPADPAKPAEAAPAVDAKKEPDKYDLKVPEGTAMDAAALTKFESSMKELGFDAKQAQKILDRDLAAQKASHEETISLLKSQDAAGVKELRSLWGTKFAEKSERVKRAFDHGDPDGSFRKALADSYLANNAKLISFVEKFTDLMGEDTIAAGPNAAKAAKDNRPLQERSKDAFQEWFKKGK